MNNINILFLLRGVGFPEGMAPTQRVRLLTKALVEQGANITVLCTNANERPPFVENIFAKGNYNGVAFEYTTGTAIRPDSFIRRRWLSMKGPVKALFRIIQFKSRNKIDCLYLYGTTHSINLSHILYILLGNALRIPIVLEMNERPWSIKPETSRLGRKISPLFGIKGTIAISQFLQDWVESEARRLKKKISIIKIPIIVNLREHNNKVTVLKDAVLLYAGSPGYDETIKFIIDAMTIVWEKYPDYRLLITGCRPNDPVGLWLHKEIVSKKLEKKVEIMGYLPREKLLTFYSQAHALMIPLFNDVRSMARFPTKIGEYLASGTPIITNAVGEIEHFFHDGENAYIAKPNDLTDYSRKIIESIENPEQSLTIGYRGKQTAAEYFEYSVYGDQLVQYFSSVIIRKES